MNSRKIFFWSLCALFFIITPSVVFYSIVYRFSPAKGIFLYGGSITLQSNPRQIEIFLDGQALSTKKISFINNSYHIDGIRSGEHFLEVKAAGFKDWSKKIIVSSGISTEYWNIILPKNDYPSQEYASTNNESFFLSPKKNYLASAEEINAELLVSVYEFSTRTTRTVFSSLEYQLPIDFSRKENIEWSPDEEKIIIPTIKNNEKHYFIVNAKTNATTDLKDLALTSELNNVRWDSSKKNIAYYTAAQTLYSIDLEKATNNKIAEDVSSYDISGSNLFYLNSADGNVYKIARTGQENPEPITTEPPTDFATANSRLVVYDKDRLYFISSDNILYIFNQGDNGKYFQKISTTATGAQFSNDGKKLLFWNDNEINVYFFRNWDVQPTRRENEIKNITRYSENIRNVQWTRDYEHVIFSFRKDIKIAELDHRDRRNVETVLTLSTDSAKIFVDALTNKLYFTDVQNEELKLYSIDFPEKEGIFGFGG